MTSTAVGEHEELAAIGRRRIVAEPLGHIPSLDGIRALAVAGVLLYHARFSWIPGGYLGVSTFFTLSGFLITSLLLREWNRADSIDLRGFWTRRFRRLLPASWLTMALVVLMGLAGVWTDDQLRALRGDLPSALLEVVNWHFVLSGRTYGDDFAAPSPLEHFWSLAIEQQFYLVLPVLVLGVVAIGASRHPARLRLSRLVVVLAALVVASAALNSALAAGSVDRAYFGTDTRMAELLVGALLAAATLRRLRYPRGSTRTVAVAAGLLGVAGTVWLWSAAPLGASWMYPWGLLLTSACTAAMVLGAVQEGPLSRALSLAPVLWVGKVSYGIYLLHWPVFLWLTPARVGWSPVPLFALRVAVTLVGAAVMFRFVEEPIRRGGRLPGWRAAVGAGVAAALILGGTFASTTDLPAAPSLSQAAMPPAPDAPTTTVPPAPLRVLVVGDRLAGSLGTALDGAEGYEAVTVSSPGCGLAMGGWVALADNSAERDVDRCRGVRERWVDAARNLTPEVVLVAGGMRDVTDRRLVSEMDWAGPGNPLIDDFLVTDVGGLIDDLGANGAEIVLLAMPHVHNTAPAPPAAPSPPPLDPGEQVLQAFERDAMVRGVPAIGHRENDPARVDHFNGLLAQLAERRGIRFMDPAEVLGSWPGGELDPGMRPDGVGFSLEAGRQIGEWLLPQLRTRVAPAPPAETSPLLAPDAPLPEAPEPPARRQAPAGGTVDVLVVGDSVAHNVAHGLDLWATRSGASLSVRNAARLGCPVARGGTYRFKQDLEQFVPECDWAEHFPEQLNSVRPEVVVLSSGIWEVVDRRLPGDDRFRHVGDPGVDRYVLRELLAAIDVLGADGAAVVLLTQTYFESGLGQGFTGLPESDPARTDRLNELLRDAASLRPGVARLIDMQSWLAAQPGGELDPAKRPDGLHFTDEFVPTIGEWLGPQLIEVGRGG